MGRSLILGIDCGTQSLRAGLYDVEGKLLAQAASTYPTDCPHVNWAEQNPEDWWVALGKAVPTCLAEAGVAGADVAALACDGTSCTLVFAKGDGAPLRPALLWMDLRAADEAKRVEESRHPGLASCGGRISAEWLLPKTLWTLAHEPDAYHHCDRIVEGVDWLTYRLCGRWVTSNSNASGKRHWTPETGWPQDLYDAVGVPELTGKSPDTVAYVGEPLGTLQPAAADYLGLTTDCVVTHGGMDGWTSPIGKDCFGPGCVSLTLGTSNVVVAETQTPRAIDGVMGPFPDGIRRGYGVYEAGQTSGGSTIGWLVDLMGLGKDAGSHERLEAEAVKLPPGSDGLVVFDAWRGNRTPYFDPRARGTICGLTLEHGPGHLYRAMLEGCAFGLRNILDTLEAGGSEVREIRACGSGAGNELWTRIIAAVTGKRVLISEEKQATCLGSAVCAAVACGAYPGLEPAAAAMAPGFAEAEPETTRESYQPYFEAYLALYERLKDTMWRLSEENDP